MGETLIADATGVLKAYMRTQEIGPDFRYGRLSMGLEIVSLIRTLELIPVVSEAEREGTIATLFTLLREQDLEDAFEAYDALAEWRKVKFERVASPRATGGVGAPSRALALPRSLELSSPRASSSSEQSRQGTTDGQQPERPSQGQDSSPRYEQLALPVSGRKERHCV
jgi:hypothetical protein